MKYKVLSNVQHDGKFYPHGSTIDLTGEAAEHLVEVGAIEMLYKAERKPSKNDDPPKTQASLDEAYEMLQNDIKNGAVKIDDVYTKSGKPNCDMLMKYAKREVASKERDAWWSKHSANPDNSEPGDNKQ